MIFFGSFKNEFQIAVRDSGSASPPPSRLGVCHAARQPVAESPKVV
jgi:hypothetical protein